MYSNFSFAHSACKGGPTMFRRYTITVLLLNLTARFIIVEEKNK